jgi:tetratricopeptide (TPR) repeat protein
MLFRTVITAFMMTCIISGCSLLESKKEPVDLIQLGIQYMNQDQTEQAIDAFSRAIKNDDKNEKALVLRGANYLKQNKNEAAKADIMRTLQINEKNSGAIYYLAMYYEQEKNYNKAIQGYNKVLDINPIYKPALKGLERCYTEKGDTKKVAEIQAVIQRDVQPKLNVKKGKTPPSVTTNIMYERIEAGAISSQDKALRENPSRGFPR